MKSSIRDDNPVIFFEHQLLYGERDPVPEGEHLVPIWASLLVIALLLAVSMLLSVMAASREPHRELDPPIE